MGLLDFLWNGSQQAQAMPNAQPMPGQPQQMPQPNQQAPEQGGFLNRIGDALIGMGDPYGMLDKQSMDPRARQQAIGMALMQLGTGISSSREKNPIAAIGQGFQYAQQAGQQTGENRMRGELFKQQIDDRKRKAGAQAKISEIMKDPNRRGELPAALADLDAGAAVNYTLGREDRVADRKDTQAFQMQMQGMNFEQQKSLLALKQQMEASGAARFSNQPVYVTDDKGNVRIMQLNDRGQAQLTAMPDGFKPAPNLQKVDTGTGTALVDPRTAQAQTVIPKDVSGAEREKKIGQATGERTADIPVAQAALTSAVSNLDRLGNEAKAIMSDPALGRITGIPGMVPNMPGGAAANVNARLETLKSQIGFSVLQAMREASKTGGALGNVSERENVLLQQNLAALSQAQSEEAFRASLKQIIDYVEQSKGRLQGAFQQTYGGQAAGPRAAPAAPNVDDLLNKYAPR